MLLLLLAGQSSQHSATLAGTRCLVSSNSSSWTTSLLPQILHHRWLMTTCTQTDSDGTCSCTSSCYLCAHAKALWLALLHTSSSYRPHTATRSRTYITQSQQSHHN